MSSTTAVMLDPDRLYEIVDGQAEEKAMPGARHGGICGRLAIELGIYLKAHPGGTLYVETSFQIGANERIPDLAFLAASRMPPSGEPESKWPMPPDLAVEIISPYDLYEKVYDKILEYLTAGVTQVWLVSPQHRMVTVYRSVTQVTVFAGDDVLLSEDLFPGFHCPLRTIFGTAQ